MRQNEKVDKKFKSLEDQNNKQDRTFQLSSKFL